MQIPCRYCVKILANHFTELLAYRCFSKSEEVMEQKKLAKTLAACTEETRHGGSSKYDARAVSGLTFLGSQTFGHAVLDSNT